MNAKLDHTIENTASDTPIQKKGTIVNRLTSAVLEGTQAKVIEIEATFTKGLPGFTIVGLAGSDIQESKERVNNQSLFDTVKYDCIMWNH